MTSKGKRKENQQKKKHIRSYTTSVVRAPAAALAVSAAWFVSAIIVK